MDIKIENNEKENEIVKIISSDRSVSKSKMLERLRKSKINMEENTTKDHKIIFVTPTDDITEDWSIRDVAIKRCPYGWGKSFNKLGNTFDFIQNIIEKEGGRVVPNRKDLFNAFHWCPLSKLKVVIVGQDPYYTIMNDGRPDANGASFSTRRDCRLRDSVQNIFLEVKKDYPEFKIPDHGDLRGWAEQGVLLLNMSLTTVAGIDKAHSHIWTGVISSVFEEIKESAPHAVVMLWGRDAQNKILKFIGKLKYLLAAHPSPKSVKGFLGCSHFKLANEHLISQGIKPIDWTLL